MIRRKPKSPSSTYLTPPPEELPSHGAAVISDWDADDEGTMSAEDLTGSRRPSFDEQASGPYFPPRPTLSDVLSNSSPPPWTLSAFTAYLSQNHCLENLEFTMDAERYRDRYGIVAAQMNGKAMSAESKECNYIRMLWKRLMDAYIVPDGPREINIPSDVRESLLSESNSSAPPSPKKLDAAAKIIYDLMEESVLVSFLNEVPVAPSPEAPPSNHSNTRTSSSRIRRAVSSRERNPTRSRSRRRGSPSSSSIDVQGSASDRPTNTLTLISSKTKRSRAQSHLSSDSGEVSLTNDSNTSASSPGHEPMTPPNTPPSSEFGGSSPRNRGDHTWKKMLVWKKKSSQGMRDSRFPTLED
ncbi:MAG: hypothetical protein Q9174_006312 [Haloplaca sp. 1 TL-2023]